MKKENTATLTKPATSANAILKIQPEILISKTDVTSEVLKLKKIDDIKPLNFQVPKNKNYQKYFYYEETINKFNKNLSLKTYYGKELLELKDDTLMQIANCYRKIFNEDWHENWTLETSLNEIVKSFQWNEKRIPIATLLYDKNTIVGFAWGVLLETQDLIPERDMPYNINSQKKMDGTKITSYWLEKIAKKKEVLLIRELGALKKFRRDIAPYILYPIYKLASTHNFKVVLFWTNIHSSTFKWALGVGWTPIYFFIEKDLVLMQGSINNLGLLKKNI